MILNTVSIWKLEYYNTKSTPDFSSSALLIINHYPKFVAFKSLFYTFTHTYISTEKTYNFKNMIPGLVLCSTYTFASYFSQMQHILLSYCFVDGPSGYFNFQHYKEYENEHQLSLPSLNSSTLYLPTPVCVCVFHFLYFLKSHNMPLVIISSSYILHISVGLPSQVTVLIKSLAISHFKTVLLRYNLHTIKLTCNCTIQWGL